MRNYQVTATVRERWGEGIMLNIPPFTISAEDAEDAKIVAGRILNPMANSDLKHTVTIDEVWTGVFPVPCLMMLETGSCEHGSICVKGHQALAEGRTGHKRRIGAAYKLSPTLGDTPTQVVINDDGWVTISTGYPFNPVLELHPDEADDLEDVLAGHPRRSQRELPDPNRPFIVLADDEPWQDSEGRTEWPYGEALAVAESCEEKGYAVRIEPATL